MDQDQHVFAKNVAGILIGLNYQVNLQDGATPILIATIQGQEVVAFCFHDVFESCSRVNGRGVIDDRVRGALSEDAAALMVATAQKMLSAIQSVAKP